MNATEILWPPGPARPHLLANEVHVWCLTLDILPAATMELAETLSADERQRAERFRPGNLQNRFVTGRGCLRAILARYLDVPPGALQFEYGTRGKPSLAAPWSGGGLQFNLSHSQGVATVALVLGREVGVDVECLDRKVDFAALVDRFFALDERRAWHALPPEEQRAAFFRAWTRKEAWLKAHGSGLAFPLDQVCVTLGPGEPARVLAIQGDRQEGARWRLDTSEPAAGYLAAVAVRSGPATVRYWCWGS